MLNELANRCYDVSIYGDIMVYIAPVKTREELIRSFETKFVKTDTCWEWTSKKTPAGYGYFYMGKAWPGGTKGCNASTASYALHKGEITKGMFVCHTCDNPACVNPDHLFLGTCKDNVRDMMQKNRHSHGERHSAILKVTAPKGERHCRAKFTNESIQKVFELRSKGITYKEIATIYGVDFTCIYKIIKRKRWKHI